MHVSGRRGEVVIGAERTLLFSACTSERPLIAVSAVTIVGFLNMENMVRCGWTARTRFFRRRIALDDAKWHTAAQDLRTC